MVRVDLQQARWSAFVVVCGRDAIASTKIRFAMVLSPTRRILPFFFSSPCRLLPCRRRHLLSHVSAVTLGPQLLLSKHQSSGDSNIGLPRYCEARGVCGVVVGLLVRIRGLNSGTAPQRESPRCSCSTKKSKVNSAGMDSYRHGIE